MVLAAAIREEIEIPEGVEVIIEDEVTVKGPNGETSRKFTYPNVTIAKEDNLVVLETAFPKKKDKSMIGTTRAHIPRSSKIVGDAKVQVKGDEVIITGVNKEDVGQTMANLEQATKIRGKDPRVFQDGIYLTSRE